MASTRPQTQGTLHNYTKPEESSAEYRDIHAGHQDKYQSIGCHKARGPASLVMDCTITAGRALKLVAFA